jgi:hypothetical protein
MLLRGKDMRRKYEHNTGKTNDPVIADAQE